MYEIIRNRENAGNLLSAQIPWMKFMRILMITIQEEKEKS